MTARILAGAVLGAALSPLCGVEAEILLKKRGKSLSQGKKEKMILAVVFAFMGAMILAAGIQPESLYLFILLNIAGIVAVTDIHERLIPNELILAILAVTTVFGIPGMIGAAGFPLFDPLRSLVGLAVCFVIFLLPSVMGKNVGAGDIKLAAACGFCLGISNSLVCIVIMGVLVCASMFIQRRMPQLAYFKSFIPMGPFLGTSMMTVLILARLPQLAGSVGRFFF